MGFYLRHLSTLVALCLLTGLAAAETAYKIVGVQAVNLRARPGADADILREVAQGATLIGSGRTARNDDDIWFEVTYGGRTGWVNSRFLTVSEAVGPGEYKIIGAAAVNLRTRPGADSDVLQEVPQGESLIASGRTARNDEDIWYEVSYGGLKGWMNARYLVLANADTRPPAATAERSASSSADLVRPPVFGDVNAPHTFVVWGSYTCPFTALLLIDVLMPIVQDSHGRVNIEWHHLPIHDPDPTLHAVGLADRGKFWDFLYNVMLAAHQDNSLQVNFGMNKIVQIAAATGISEAQIRRAYSDQANWEAVKQDYLAAKLLGVTKTPALFYEGYYMTPDGLPVATAELDKSLRTMLKMPSRQ